MTKRVGGWLALLPAGLVVLACSSSDNATPMGVGNAGQGGAGATSGAGGAAGVSNGGASGVSAGAGAGGSGASIAPGGSGGEASIDGSVVDADGGMMSSDPGTVISEPEDEARYVFDQNELRTYNILVAQTDLDTINANPQAEQYVQGMLEHDGMQYGPVGIRYKGSVGAFRGCTGFGSMKTGKCSIKVAFDYLDDEARFYGLKKLNFHSMNADPSQLRERLVYAMFRENGIAAPRAMHARLLINGQLEGLFVIAEQIDGRFTRARFTEGGEGNLYKEIWPMHDDASAYIAALESNTDEMPSAARMLAFKDAIQTGGDALNNWIDRDYFLRYLAADRVTINDDGALHWWCTELGQGNNPGGIGNHNYYWYEAEGVDRLWLVPWDVDMSLAGEPIAQINPEWREPGMCSCDGGGFGFGSSAPVCDPLIETWASWTTDYEAAVDAFIAGPFSETNVNAKLDAWVEQIDAAVQESGGVNGAPAHSDWMMATDALRTTIANARTNRGTMY